MNSNHKQRSTEDETNQQQQRRAQVISDIRAEEEKLRELKQSQELGWYPQAYVTHWAPSLCRQENDNDTFIYGWVQVLCPFCERIHHHASAFIPERIAFMSKCPEMHVRSMYHLTYPPARLDNDESSSAAAAQFISYEIDGGKRCFVTVSRQIQLIGAEGEDEEEEEKKHQDLPAATTTPSSRLRADSATGFLDDDELSAQFQKKMNLSGGATKTLHQAATSGNIEIFEAYLESNPSAPLDIRAKNEYGRTPLMEAALWGNFKLVKALLQSKTLYKLLEPKDILTARAMAQDTIGNARRREKSDPSYKDDVKRMCSRQAIRGLLKARLEPQISEYCRDVDAVLFHPYNGPFDRYFFCPSFRISNIKSTKRVAILDRGPPFQLIGAISGWGDSEPVTKYGASNIKFLAKSEWTSKVQRLCDMLEYQLEAKPEYDQGQPGRYNACHAEKQLLTYLMATHSLMVQNQVRIGSEVVSREPIAELFPVHGTADAVSRELYPPGIEKRVKILVNKSLYGEQDVCDDCNRFKLHLEDFFGMQIDIKAVDWKAKHFDTR